MTSRSLHVTPLSFLALSPATQDNIQRFVYLETAPIRAAALQPPPLTRLEALAKVCAL